jgi:hypothetical protein
VQILDQSGYRYYSCVATSPVFEYYLVFVWLCSKLPLLGQEWNGLIGCWVPKGADGSRISDYFRRAQTEGGHDGGGGADSTAG